jgi:hypothetical protein
MGFVLKMEKRKEGIVPWVAPEWERFCTGAGTLAAQPLETLLHIKRMPNIRAYRLLDV